VEGISWPSGALSPPPSCAARGSGEETLGGWSIKAKVPPEAEVEMKEEVWEPGNTNICLKTFWAKLVLEQLQSAEGSRESGEELAYPPLLRG